MVGGPGWDTASRDQVAAFAEALNCPVVTAFRGKSLIDNTHAHYAGEAGIGCNPALVDALRDSDLILAIGPRLGEMTTQSYRLFELPDGIADRLIHIHAGGEELGRVHRPMMAAAARAGSAMTAIASKADPERAQSREAWVKGRREAYEAWSTPVEVTGAVNPSEIWASVAEKLGDKAILTNGAGNFAAWLHRFYQHCAWPSQLAPTSGAMGYGLPAAIAAKLEHPERPVICAAGDGDFLMAAPELATAVQHGADIIVCVFDNGAYGTIRMHQEMHYAGRVSGTDLSNPDFKADGGKLWRCGLLRRIAPKISCPHWRLRWRRDDRP
jgi:acetolactate synthase-1/2/3 large subunit